MGYVYTKWEPSVPVRVRVALSPSAQALLEDRGKAAMLAVGRAKIAGLLYLSEGYKERYHVGTKVLDSRVRKL